MSKVLLRLDQADRTHLQGLVRQQKISVRVHRRATALLALATPLRERPRSGRPPRIDGTQRARVTALACSTPPAGHARWSLRLLADRSVELGLVAAISHNHVRAVLKKTSPPCTASRRGASER